MFVKFMSSENKPDYEKNFELIECKRASTYDKTIDGKETTIVLLDFVGDGLTGFNFYPKSDVYFINDYGNTISKLTIKQE